MTKIFCLRWISEHRGRAHKKERQCLKKGSIFVAPRPPSTMELRQKKKKITHYWWIRTLRLVGASADSEINKQFFKIRALSLYKNSFVYGVHFSLLGNVYLIHVIATSFLVRIFFLVFWEALTFSNFFGIANWEPVSIHCRTYLTFRIRKKVSLIVIPNRDYCHIWNKSYAIFWDCAGRRRS